MLAVLLGLVAVAPFFQAPSALGASQARGAVSKSPLVGPWRGAVVGFIGTDAVTRATVDLNLTSADLGAVVGTMTWGLDKSAPANTKPCIERVRLARRISERQWMLRVALFRGVCTEPEGSWTYVVTRLKGSRLRVEASSTAPKYRGWSYRGTLIARPA